MGGDCLLVFFDNSLELMLVFFIVSRECEDFQWRFSTMSKKKTFCVASCALIFVSCWYLLFGAIKQLFGVDVGLLIVWSRSPRLTQYDYIWRLSRSKFLEARWGRCLVFPPGRVEFSVAQWGRGGSGPARVGDVQRVMTTGTRVFRHSVPLVCKFWVGRPEDARSVPLAALALVSRLLDRPLSFLPMSSLTKTGGGCSVIYDHVVNMFVSLFQVHIQ
ncbi:hypothetical protein AVEN_172653-1 [Araneus ventricosus]|uniref:Uncharacterized protein n=1 Tax=Araneus ventricosus TaxID=182803 RepID=A0A4Y2NEM4_ARAVE|nr:hypothetical protein AVEN_172653-1 [Araneus ventricosus]